VELRGARKMSRTQWQLIAFSQSAVLLMFALAVGSISFSKQNESKDSAYNRSEDIEIQNEMTFRENMRKYKKQLLVEACILGSFLLFILGLIIGKNWNKSSIENGPSQ
jgi:hypothetical protein